jgi:hypothetical protein
VGQKAPSVFQEIPSRVCRLTKESDAPAMQSRSSDANACIILVAART